MNKKKALLISCFNLYDKRLKPIKELLQEEYEVTILMSDFIHTKKCAVEEYLPDCIYIHVLKYKKNISIKRILSHIFFGRSVNKYIKQLQPDLIYLLIPPNSTAKHCLKYKKNHPTIKYYVDLIDLWPESMPLGMIGSTFLCEKWKKLRNDSVAEADHVFTECNLYQKKLESLIGDPARATTIYLFRKQTEEECMLVRQCLEKKSQRNINDRKLIIGYLGSINHIIDIEGISQIVKKLIKNDYYVQMRVIGDGENRKAFLLALEETGAEVIYYGKVYDQIQKIKYLGCCDYAFNMMKESVTVGLTIKSIDYFSMGIPVINNIKGDTWELIEKEGIGINWNGDIEKCMICLSEFNAEEVSNKVIKCFQLFFSENSVIEKFADKIVG